MPALARLIPCPHRLETDGIDVAAPLADVWARVRQGNLAQSRVVRALFSVRTLASRAKGHEVRPSLRLDDLQSSTERPGFQVLVDDAPREVVVGAVGQVWRLDIPFVHVADAAEFLAFQEPGFVKVAWAIQLTPLGASATHVGLEVRVHATDERSWAKFRRYFHIIGPASRFIRRSMLRQLVQELERAHVQHHF